MPMIENRKDGEMFPRMGNDNDMFERLSEYIDAFDKTWKERIKPASKEQIERLKNESQLKKYVDDFPKSYLTFLESMGVEDGGLLSDYLIGTVNIDVMIDVYKEYQQFDQEIYETPYLSFFLYSTGGEVSIDLSGKPIGNIFVTEAGEVANMISESFEKLLFQAAFQQFESFKYWVGFSASQNDLYNALKKQKMEDRENVFEEIEKIGEKNNLKKAWFSDMIYNIMLGTNLSFVVKKSFAGGVAGFVTGEETKAVEQIANEIVNLTGADVYKNNLV